MTPARVRVEALGRAFLVNFDDQGARSILEIRKRRAGTYWHRRRPIGGNTMVRRVINEALDRRNKAAHR